MLLSLSPSPRPNVATHTLRPETQDLTTAMIVCIACCKSIASCGWVGDWGAFSCLGHGGHMKSCD